MAVVKAGVVVLDCADPEQLAAFYQGLLEAETTDESANRIELRGVDGTRLALRRDVNVTPPSWPRPENSLQAHLEFQVDDLDEAERRVVDLGGRPTQARHAPGPLEERGYADPAGHSFVLRRVLPGAPKQD
ncbi:VOC family protein [Streptomyces sp. TRM68367]|uniref:VOC family protein n=1 Tax=Streptomyces sp. TRM68367 TaxID=2758415 RepID=UPI00165AC63E|nr:VOC family protein [Streptomyces sp. TRM68367]MBC9724863.1 VOC family protein [Streptomyces sp. TRM68367]